MATARNENDTPLGRFIHNKFNSKDWVIGNRTGIKIPCT